MAGEVAASQLRLAPDQLDLQAGRRKLGSALLLLRGTAVRPVLGSDLEPQGRVVGVRGTRRMYESAD